MGDQQSTGAIDRVLAALTAVLARDDASIGDIARHTQIPLSTAHRLTAALVRHKLLTREAGGYVVSHRLATVGSTRSAHRALAIAARPIVRKFARDSKVAAHVGTFDGEMVTYLVKESAPGMQLFTREGMQLEAYCSAVGKMLLAHLDPEALERYLAAGPLIPLTSATSIDQHFLREELAEARSSGKARDRGEVAEGLNCLAMPIRSARGNVIAALSLSSPDLARNVDEIAPALAQAIAEIEAEL